MKDQPIKEIRDLLKLEESVQATEDKNSVRWRLPDGTIHRKFGPAIELPTGSKYWYLNGKLHREDGPAIEGADGEKNWFLIGKRHRENGPAIEDAYGTREWRIEGKLHRTDGPAVEWANGEKEWWLHGKRQLNPNSLFSRILQHLFSLIKCFNK